MIVDTHTHASPRWMEPIETLDMQMRKNGVDQALLMPLRDDFDMEYLFSCAERFPGRFFAVAGIDTNDPAAVDRLAALAQRGAVALRLTANDRSPGSDPLAIWAGAAALGVPVSALGEPVDFLTPEFARIVTAFPHLPIVLEHLGGAGPFWGHNRPFKSLPMDLYQGILGLARYPNLYMKMPGVAEFMPRPRPMVAVVRAHMQPVYEMAIDAFGASRLMWGSDYPPSGNREGYANALAWPRELVQYKSEAERDQVFGGTARALFRLDR